MKNTLRIFTLFVSASLAFAGSGSKSAVSALSPDLQNLAPNTKVTVLIQFSSKPSQAMLSALIGQGATTKRQFRYMPFVVATVPAKVLPVLAKLPFVKYISPDRQVQRHLDITTATVGANLAWQSGYTGAGVAVAVIDSGIDNTNADLSVAGTSASRVVYSQDFVGTGTADQYGHGTHVAGIIGSNGTNSSGAGFTRTFTGIAPQVNLLNLRVLDENGSGSDSQVIAAIEEAVALQKTYNIGVINLSLGRGIFESYTVDPLCQAVELAWKSGITVVVAAGNDGRDNSQGNQGWHDYRARQRSLCHHRGRHEYRRNSQPVG